MSNYQCMLGTRHFVYESEEVDVGEIERQGNWKVSHKVAARYLKSKVDHTKKSKVDHTNAMSFPLDVRG